MSSSRPERPAPFAADVHYAGGAGVGERKNQEDCHAFELAPDGSELLAVLADGMGGHAAGEVASQEAVRAFVAAFRAAPELPVPPRLAAALARANRALGEHIARQPELSGMGCTLVAAHCGPAGLTWISVGDSPLFLLRDGQIAQINADHSMAGAIEEGVRAGRITREEADSHPARNALRSALLGESEPELIDLREIPLALAPGDRVILASDGLQTLPDAEIGRIALAPPTARDTVAALLQAVERVGKPRQDNTTVQVIMPRASGAAGGGSSGGSATGGNNGTLGRVLIYLGAALGIAAASALLTMWFFYPDRLPFGGGAGPSGKAGDVTVPGWQPVGPGAAHDAPPPAIPSPATPATGPAPRSLPTTPPDAQPERPAPDPVASPVRAPAPRPDKPAPKGGATPPGTAPGSNEHKPLPGEPAGAAKADAGPTNVR